MTRWRHGFEVVVATLARCSIDPRPLADAVVRADDPVLGHRPAGRPVDVRDGRVAAVAGEPGAHRPGGRRPGSPSASRPSAAGTAARSSSRAALRTTSSPPSTACRSPCRGAADGAVLVPVSARRPADDRVGHADPELGRGAGHAADGPAARARHGHRLGEGTA